MKYKCPKCDTVIEEGISYCPNCGQPFKWPEKIVEPEPEPQPEPEPKAKEEKKPSQNFLMAVIAILLIIILAIVLAFTLGGKEKAPEVPSTNSGSKNLTLEECHNVIISSFQDNDNCYVGYSLDKLDENINTIIINVSVPGASYSKLQDPDTYSDLAEEYRQISALCRQVYTSNGYDDWHATIYIRNDLNSDKILTVICDGVIVST